MTNNIKLSLALGFCSISGELYSVLNHFQETGLTKIWANHQTDVIPKAFSLHVQSRKQKDMEGLIKNKNVNTSVK